MRHRCIVVGCAALLCAAGSAFAQNGGLLPDGPDWVEGGIDAGSKVETAQQTLGTGDLHSISGTLGGTEVPDFEDMYLIRVSNPTLFSISGGTADFDPVLWLFNVTKAGQAFGLLANDNGPGGPLPVLLGVATDGTGAAVTTPGVYAIAVSAAGRFPISINGGIFTFASSTEISGPDGPGGINPHTDWAGPGAGGSYSVNATGVGFYSVPAPGAAILLCLGAFAAGTRRRK